MYAVYHTYKQNNVIKVLKPFSTDKYGPKMLEFGSKMSLIRLNISKNNPKLSIKYGSYPTNTTHNHIAMRSYGSLVRCWFGKPFFACITGGLLRIILLLVRNSTSGAIPLRQL